MKLFVQKSENRLDNSKVAITKRETPCFDNLSHYHAQYELIYVSRSYGMRFVGDSVSNFIPGELVLVGPYLPHLWRNDPAYYTGNSTDEVSTIIIKFDKDFIGEGTFDRPEFADIKKLLDLSKLGVCYSPEQTLGFHEEIMSLTDLSPADQSIRLLGLLHRLSSVKEREVLSTSDVRQQVGGDSNKIDKVLKYISENYHHDIDLQEIADVACMTTNSFCRFFKKRTSKSFRQFLNEVRIKNASRLLVQERFSISDVCYEVGFNSITNFNKQFKQIVGKTPKEYRCAI